MNKKKLLIACLSYKNYTGSELYVYELARAISAQWEVTICSPHIGGPLCNDTDNAIHVVDMNNIPDENWDLIHTQHTPVTEYMCQRFPLVPKICTIHSEIISLENPVIHPSIKHYICIREEIQNHIITHYNIPKEKTSIIYNLIDDKRFCVSDSPPQQSILFCGTIDYLRINAIRDTLKMCEDGGNELWLVGNDNGNYLPELKSHPLVRHTAPTYHIEHYVKACKETAGILLGRSTIEGYLCGKNGWIYDVDIHGNILHKSYTYAHENIAAYDYHTNTQAILNAYDNINNRI